MPEDTSVVDSIQGTQPHGGKWEVNYSHVSGGLGSLWVKDQSSSDDGSLDCTTTLFRPLNSCNHRFLKDIIKYSTI